MTAPAISVMAPTVPARVDEWDEAGECVAQTGMARLWSGQSWGIDAATMFARLAGRGIAVPCGTAVTVTGLADPRRAALEARSISAVTGHPVVYGVGPGSARVRSLLESGGQRRLDDLRRWIRVFTDEVGDGGSPGARLGEPIATPGVRLGLGVLRAGAASLAGELADDVITWLCPADHLRRVIVPTVVRAADASGRPRPRIVALVAVAVSRPGRDRDALAALAVGGHAALPHYRDALRQAGVVLDGDPDRTVRALIEARLFRHGTVEEIADGIVADLGGVADEVVLMATATSALHGRSEALADMTELHAALVHRTSTPTAPVERRNHVRSADLARTR